MTMWRPTLVFLILVLSGVIGTVWHAGDCAESPQAWGEPVQGISVQLSLASTSFRPGDEINAVTRLRNTGTATRVLWMTGADYRWYLYDAHGNPVPKTEEAIKNESFFPVGYPESRAQIRLQPGTEFPQANNIGAILNLRTWFKITQPGTYHVIVIRRIDADSHNAFDFAISNLCTFEVTR